VSYGRGCWPRSGVSEAAAKDDIQIPRKIPYIIIIIDELADLMWATLGSGQMDFTQSCHAT
jgi:hypothetical protein